jgi:hypothetical protein
MPTQPAPDTRSFWSSLAQASRYVELVLEFERAGDQKRYTLDDYLSLQGDYVALAAYARFLHPVILVLDGCPWAFFGPDETEPLDVFHVDLLHHCRPPLGSDICEPAGHILAHCWTQQLRISGQPGKFVFDGSRGEDVVYVPDA